MGTEGSVLVPPLRLGALLRQARTAAGLEIGELAERTDLSTMDLDEVEHGRRSIDDELLSRLIVLYGVEDAGLVPPRSHLVIDLDEGRVEVHDHGSAAIGLPEPAAPDAILARYLALVYRLRELPLGTPLSLRDIDLDVLSTALHLDSHEVEHRLHRLMADEETIEHDQRRIRRRLLLPLVGVVIAATAVGTLLLVAEDDPAPAPAPAGSVVVEPGPARVADPVVVDATSTPPSIADAAVVDASPVVTDIGDPAVVDGDADPAGS